MTRNNNTANTILATSTSRVDIVAALKAVGAYSGKTPNGVRICQLGKADLVAHARRIGTEALSNAVGALLIGADVAAGLATEAAKPAKAPAKPAKPATQLTVVDGALVGPKPKGWDAEQRGMRDATTRKLAAAITNATADADGVILLTAADFVAAGLGKTWARLPRWLWVAGPSARTAAILGYTGTTSRGTVTLTPIATTVAAVQAS